MSVIFDAMATHLAPHSHSHSPTGMGMGVSVSLMRPQYASRVFDIYASSSGDDNDTAEEHVPYRSSADVTLAPFELKCALVATLGYKPTRVELNQVVEGARRAGKDGVDRDTFCAYVQARHAAVDPEEWIRAAFRALDETQQGFLDCRRLASLGGRRGANQPVGALADALDALDDDGDGRLTARDVTDHLRRAMHRR